MQRRNSIRRFQSTCLRNGTQRQEVLRQCGMAEAGESMSNRPRRLTWAEQCEICFETSSVVLNLPRTTTKNAALKAA
jgi:hypothetical protein